MKETTAMQLGRDDYKAFHAIASTLPESIMRCDLPPTPFPKGSADAAEWLEGWNREEMRNPKSEMSEFQKVKAVMLGEKDAG